MKEIGATSCGALPCGTTVRLSCNVAMITSGRRFTSSGTSAVSPGAAVVSTVRIVLAAAPSTVTVPSMMRVCTVQR